MKLNTSGAWNALGQGLGQAASAVATVENYKYQKVEAARSNQYSINATNAKAQLDLAVKDWNVKNSVAMQSSGYNYQSAREELNTQLKGILDMQSSTWFDGDTEHSDRFTEEVFEPYLAQVGGILADNEAANINKRIQNKANDSISFQLYNMDHGTNPADAKAGIKSALSARVNASNLTPDEQNLLTASVMSQYNSSLITNTLSKVIDTGSFTLEDTSKVIDVLKGNLAVDANTPWGKVASSIMANQWGFEGRDPFTTEELDSVKDFAKSKINTLDNENRQIVNESLATMQTTMSKMLESSPDSLTLNYVNDYISKDPILKANKDGVAYTSVQAARSIAKNNEDRIRLAGVQEEGLKYDVVSLTFKNSEGSYKGFDSVAADLRASYAKDNKDKYFDPKNYQLAEDLYVAQSQQVYTGEIGNSLIEEYSKNYGEKGVVVSQEMLDSDSRFALLGDFSDDVKQAIYAGHDALGLTVESRQEAAFNTLFANATNTMVSQDDRKRAIMDKSGSISSKQLTQLLSLVTNSPASDMVKQQASIVDGFVVTELMRKKVDDVKDFSVFENNTFNRISGRIKGAFTEYAMEQGEAMTGELADKWYQDNVISMSKDAKRYLLHGITDEGSWEVGNDGKKFLNLLQTNFASGNELDKDLFPVSMGKLAVYTDSLMKDKLGIDPNITTQMITNEGPVYMIKASQHKGLAQYGDDVAVGVRFNTDGNNVYPVYSVEISDENGPTGTYEYFTIPGEVPVTQVDIAKTPEEKQKAVAVASTGGFGPTTQQILASQKKNKEPEVGDASGPAWNGKMDRTKTETDSKAYASLKDLDTKQQTLLRKIMETWVNNNKGVTPSKDNFAMHMGYVQQKHIDAMFQLVTSKGK